MNKGNKKQRRQIHFFIEANLKTDDAKPPYETYFSSNCLIRFNPSSNADDVDFTFDGII